MLGQKLVSFYNVSAVSKVPTAVLGGIPNIEKLLATKASHRIAVYPCKRADLQGSFDVEGFWLVLSYYLEAVTDSLVYRLIGFDKDEKALSEGLDNNYSLLPSFRHEAGTWLLEVTLESAAVNEDDVVLVWREVDARDFWQLLPRMAGQIVEKLALPSREHVDFAHDALFTWSDSALVLIKSWQALLAEYFISAQWNDSRVYDLYQELEKETSLLADAWQTVWVAALSVLYHPPLLGVSQEIRDALATWELTAQSCLFLADKRYKAGQPHEAIALIETCLMDAELDHEAIKHLTAKLVQLGLLSGQWDNTLRVCQTAIEEDVADASVLASYAQVLATLAANEFVIKELVLAEDVDAEISEAYQQSLAQKLDGGVLLRLLEHLAVLQEIELFEVWFAKALELGDEALLLEALDLLDNFESFDGVIDALADKSHQNPDKPFYLLVLAKAYLLNEEIEEFSILLKQLESLESMPYMQERELLRLQMRWHDFDYWFGEFVTQIDAKNPLNDKQLALLEEVIEVAPSYTDAYLALAKAYRLIEDDESALEVITDAQSVVSHPALWALGAEILWDSDDSELGIAFLLKGLESYPDNITLLAKMGKFLFESEQMDEARQYLAQAEALATTNHPELQSVKRYIANQLGRE